MNFNRLNDNIISQIYKSTMTNDNNKFYTCNYTNKCICERCKFYKNTKEKQKYIKDIVYDMKMNL